MQLLNHPTCITLIEVLASKTTIFLVLELVTGGELFDRIVADGRFDEDSALKYFRQLIDGLEHCHTNGVCHRDLKPENLLLDNQGDLRITDFGLSSFNENQDEREFLHTTCGTPNYVAPEVLMDKGYEGQAADIWSAGVILYVLLSGFLPFDEAQMVDLFRKIISADFQYPAWMSREAQILISRLLEPDPERRATIAEIRASAFFTGKKIEDDEDTTNNRSNLTNLHFFSWDNENLSAVVAAAEAKAATFAVGKQKFLSKWKGQRHVVTPSSTLSEYLHSNALLNQTRPHGSSISATPTHNPAAMITTTVNTQSVTIEGQGASPNTFASATTTHNGIISPTSSMVSTCATSTYSTALVEKTRHEKEEERFGPKNLNAFDLINMVSGQSMNNMLMFNKDITAPSFTQFTSRLRTEDSMAIIDYVLLETPNLRYRICYRKCNVSLIWTNSKNHRIGANIELFKLTPTLHMVQCKRVDGSILAFHEFYKRFKDDVNRYETSGAISKIYEKLAEWQTEHDLLVNHVTQPNANSNGIESSSDPNFASSSSYSASTSTISVVNVVAANVVNNNNNHDNSSSNDNDDSQPTSPTSPISETITSGKNPSLSKTLSELDISNRPTYNKDMNMDNNEGVITTDNVVNTIANDSNNSSHSNSNILTKHNHANDEVDEKL